MGDQNPYILIRLVDPMRLRSRVLVIFFCIILLVFLCVGVILPSSLYEKNLIGIEYDIINQLKHIDFALSNFIEEVEYDIRQLEMDDDVLYPDDTGFTSFVNVSPVDTFMYSISEREQVIIEELNEYRLTHPSINSVYMGRETGTFVRSHPRPLPTEYDPRTRPWYILAKEHPGQVMITEPYQSVTSPDINIGIVSAMRNKNGTVYGVIGADITLAYLTKYMTEFNFGRDAKIILINSTGTILAAKDPNLVFMNITLVTGNKTHTLLNSSEGIITLPDSYFIYYTSPHLGWKYGVIIPFSQIEKEMLGSILTILFFVLIALILLSIITIVALDRTVINPISNLTKIARNISDTGDLNHRIVVETGGEIGDLYRSFDAMIVKIQEESNAKMKAFNELSEYRDNLSKIIRERTIQLEEANSELQKRAIQLESVNQDLKVAKEHAEDADRLKSAFLATMSHELRTPLNSIIGFTGIILQRLAGPLNSEQEKQMGLVQQSARHLLALINDVLDISKIEAEELNIASERVELYPSIVSVIKTMQPIADQKGLLIEISLDPDIGFIMGDKRRIEQVIMNLMSNAIKFTDKGSVTVTSSVMAGKAVISVKDTGMGINEKDLEGLFRPFHQVDSGTTRRYEGTGLGLSISKKLVELHGGRITVESRVGEGSTFSVFLPLEGEK
jgi:signal transduction histidine kinase